MLLRFDFKGSFTRIGCIPVTNTILYPDGHSLSESLMDVEIGRSKTPLCNQESARGH